MILNDTYHISHLDASSVIMASMTSFCLILGRIFLREKIPNSFIGAALLCFIGLGLDIYGLVTTVLQEENTHIDLYTALPVPNLLTTSAPSSGRNIHTSTVTQLLFGFIVAIFSGLGEAVSVVVQKYYEDEFPSVHVLTFWSTAVGFILSLCCLLVFQYQNIAIPHDLDTCLLVLGHSSVVGIGLTLYIISMKVASTYVLSIFHNAHIPTALLFETVWFGNLQPIPGGIYDLVGPIILSIGLLIPPVWTLTGAILYK